MNTIKIGRQKNAFLANASAKGEGSFPPPLKNVYFFLNINKSLDCSETKEYVKIFFEFIALKTLTFFKIYKIF